MYNYIYTPILRNICNCLCGLLTNIPLKNKPTINILHSITENHNRYNKRCLSVINRTYKRIAIRIENQPTSRFCTAKMSGEFWEVTTAIAIVSTKCKDYEGRMMF